MPKQFLQIVHIINFLLLVDVLENLLTMLIVNDFIETPATQQSQALVTRSNITITWLKFKTMITPSLLTLKPILVIYIS
jgi:hypothetical protein